MPRLMEIKSCVVSQYTSYSSRHACEMLEVIMDDCPVHLQVKIGNFSGQ